MNRRDTSGGQAIILVTLALLAMCGMMGLAVDMGWSFFVHKQAQTAADAAALAAVQEAITRIAGNGTAVTAFTCAANGGTGATQADCRTTAVNCSTVVGTGSNLDNGCQYAKKNGFDWTNPRQNVTVQSNDGAVGDRPPTAPGVVNLTYWVTVRTVQTVPQLFSAVISRTEGTVSAVATAAIAAAIGPGQFYGMNRHGDCTGTTGTAGGVLTNGGNCGVDYLGAQGNGTQTNCGNFKANLCAPAGIILASNCVTSVVNQCTSDGAGNGDAMGGSLTIMGDGSGGGGLVNGTWRDMGGNSLTPCPSGSCKYTTNGPTFADPTAPNPQPPLVSEFTPDPSTGRYPSIPACGLPDGIVPNNAVLGPLQYYAYASGDPTKKPTGAPLTLSGDVTFNRDSSINGCPGSTKVFTPGASQTSSFPTYIFYGGVSAGSNSITMRAGQYVMAGTTGTSIFDEKNGSTSIKPDSTAVATGAMMITTDGNYPGLPDQWALLTNAGIDTSAIQDLKQGQITMKNGQPGIEMQGLINSNVAGSNLPPALNAYSGIAIWQDRRNSAVAYNAAPGSPGCPDCTGDDGTVLYCATGGDCAIPDSAKLATRLAANHVTATSPGGIFADSGNANVALQGVFYQPRGAWMDLSNGNVGFTCPVTFGGNPNSQCPLQIVTGALLLGNGTTSVNLAGPTNPIITYKPVLIH